MSRRLTRRQRLKRDPANQRLGKLIAWVRRRPHVVEPVIALQGVVRPPRLKYLYRGERRQRSRYWDKRFQ